MTTTMAIEEIKLTLPELLDTLSPGAELILTRNQKPVAKLVTEASPSESPRRPGLGRGMISLLVEDDEHLDGFEGPTP